MCYALDVPCLYLYVNMCKLYTPEVLPIRASCLSACLGCFFFFVCWSAQWFISSRIEYFAVFMVCIEKERAAADLHIGDLVPNHSVYCVWTGHTSVVTGCCSATCTTVQHLVKCRAKLLFSISPLNRSLSLYSFCSPFLPTETVVHQAFHTFSCFSLVYSSY